MTQFTRRLMFSSIGAASIAAISIAKTAQATQPMDETTDRLAIIETVNKIAILSDRRDWEAVKNCFTEQVEFDYTSLNGGEPATVAAATQVKQWADFFTSRFKNTQHLIGSHAVTLNGDTASAIAHFQAHHTYLDTSKMAWLL
ncbi:MAG: nuclear transport factor 2 family protein, partial [Microcoleus sp. SIO2G3]|nr:nuclear transport factor 2 family protein [Microcoleus sp. SIO2G3]